MRRHASLAAAPMLAAVLALSGCGTAAVGTADTGPHISDIRPANPPSPRRSAPAAAHARRTAHSKPGDPAHAKLDAYAAVARRQFKATYGHSFDKLYSAVRILPVYPGGLKFVYVFQNFVDVATAARHLRTTVPILGAAFTSQVEPQMKQEGFPHPSATWTYLNPDGSLVWSHTAS